MDDHPAGETVAPIMVEPVRLVNAAVGHAVWWLGYQMQRAGQPLPARDEDRSTADRVDPGTIARLSGVETEVPSTPRR